MIDITPLQALRQKLERRARSPEPVMRMVANRLRAVFRENFRAGGRPPWTPLAASTILGKKMMGLPESLRTPTGRKPRRLMQRDPLSGRLQLEATNILIRTGRLRDSVGQSYHPDHVTRIHGWTLEIGTTVPYAPYHQQGTAPYVIRPREAKALRFVGNDGDWVFAREVHHPGLPSRPFLTVPEDEADALADAILDWLLSEGGGE